MLEEGLEEEVACIDMFTAAVIFCRYSYIAIAVAFTFPSRVVCCSESNLLPPVPSAISTDDSNDPSLASLPASRSRNRGASSPQTFDCQTETDTQTAVPPPTLAPCIIVVVKATRPASILLFRNISTAA